MSHYDSWGDVVMRRTQHDALQVASAVALRRAMSV